MVELKGDERLDYLLADENMRIIQSPTVFAFSLDAVLLANFASIPIAKGRIMDLCSGNAVIPLLLSKRTKAQITGVEIQERLYDMAERNVALNGLGDQVKMIHGDLKEMPAMFGNGPFDAITCNPPYFKTPGKNEQNLNEHLTIARHEIMCTLDDVILACRKLVKPGGKVSLVHRPDRLLDIVTSMREQKIEPKRMQLVYPKPGKEANILLIEGVRDGNPGLKILPPLYSHKQGGGYTEELEEILYGSK
ncbi:tRNA1(Val) (adenine(37)-N6)-methyltransferase [Terribacillus saccharophilus]|uniref:tRNA1(Val) (adenine(37)-N6)-methyltransferase n=1 Tax=Terribacillus saccharophilus TaxID=361277 RepID=UPI003982D3FB